MKVPKANIRSLAHIRWLHIELSGSEVDEVEDFEKLNKRAPKYRENLTCIVSLIAKPDIIAQHLPITEPVGELRSGYICVTTQFVSEVKLNQFL